MRMMTFRIGVIALTVLGMALAQQHPGAPNFSAQIYADGEAWGTKGLSDLPPPNDHNAQSFDKLYKFMVGNAAAGQLPVAEASPGNKNYNGGRWDAQMVLWISGTPTVLKSEAEILMQQNLGHVAIGSLNDYFLCPLLPVK